MEKVNKVKKVFFARRYFIVDYNYIKGIPGMIDALPENSYEAEPPEVEVLSISIDRRDNSRNEVCTDLMDLLSESTIKELQQAIINMEIKSNG